MDREVEIYQFIDKTTSTPQYSNQMPEGDHVASVEPLYLTQADNDDRVAAYKHTVVEEGGVTMTVYNYNPDNPWNHDEVSTVPLYR
jgi:hypothetical protein